MDVRSACNLFRLVFRMRGSSNPCQWNSANGSPVWTLRKWMRERNWLENAPWCWSNQHITVNVHRDGNLPSMLHKLRDGWKLYCWSRFLATGRHEAPEVSGVDHTKVVNVAWQPVRAQMKRPACRTAALGAAVSPAWFHGRNHIFCDRRLWCNHSGAWFHLCCECPHCALARPAVPDCPLLPRFGWGNAAQVRTILPYLGDIVEAIWQSRWRG